MAGPSDRAAAIGGGQIGIFAACIHVPTLIIDIVHCLATGFDLPHSLISALSRNLFFLIGLTVPLFALASATRNAVEFILGAALLAALVEMVDRLFGNLFGVVLLRSIFSDPLDESNWIIVAAKYGVIGCGSAMVIAVQYHGRKTGLGRIVLAWLVVLGIAASYLPWQFVFGVQDALAAPGPLALGFDTEAARLRPNFDGRRNWMQLGIPLRVSGLPGNASLVLERDEAAEFKVQEHSVQGRAAIVTDDVRGPWLSQGMEGQAIAVFSVDAKTRDEIKELPAVDLDLDLAVTVLEKIGEEAAFPVSEDYAAVPLLGRCRVRPPNPNAVGASPLTAECVQAGRVPAVTTMEAFSPSREEAYAGGTLRSSYAPFFAQFLPDSLNRVRVGMMPRKGLAVADLYPGSRIVMRNYRALQHRKFQLKLEGVRLQDFVPANNS